MWRGSSHLYKLTIGSNGYSQYPQLILFQASASAGLSGAPSGSKASGWPVESEAFRNDSGTSLSVSPFTPSAPTSASRCAVAVQLDRKSTRLNSSHMSISYAVFCLKKKKK